MTTVDSSYVFLDGDDVGAFAEVIAEATGVESEGSPWWIEPEPNEIEKRRFRPDREKPTGYMATFSIQGPGRRKPDEAIVFHVAFDQPAANPEVTDETIAGLLAARGVDVPTGWTVHADWGSGFRAESLDVRPTSPSEIAGFVFGALRALGAELPTGRWRATWQSLR